MMTTVGRTDLYHLIDKLPESMLPEVSYFLEFLHFKVKKEAVSVTPYLPVPLGGLWRDVTISDETIDIVALKVLVIKAL